MNTLPIQHLMTRVTTAVPCWLKQPNRLNSAAAWGRMPPRAQRGHGFLRTDVQERFSNPENGCSNFPVGDSFSEAVIGSQACQCLGAGLLSDILTKYLAAAHTTDDVIVLKRVLFYR